MRPIDIPARYSLFYKYLPPIIGGLFTFLLALYFKFLAQGGPIISDEWGYLKSGRDFGILRAPITETGNYLFSYFSHVTVGGGVIHSSYTYLLVNCLAALGIYLVINEMIHSIGPFVRSYLFVMMSLAGIGIYSAVLMPEVISCFLSVLSVYLISSISEHASFKLILLGFICILAPSLKIHSILLTISLFCAILVLSLVSRNPRYFIIFFVAAIVTYLANYPLIRRSSLGFYISKSNSIGFDLMTCLNYSYNIFLIILVFTAIFGDYFFNFTKNEPQIEIRVLLKVQIVLTILVFGYFNMSISKYNAFESNRLHVRYLLPLFTMLIPLYIKYLNKNYLTQKRNMYISVCSFTILFTLQHISLNLYPWDDALFFALSTGTSKFGWKLGGPSPVTIFIFLFFAAIVILTFRKVEMTAKVIYSTTLSSVVISSFIGISVWVTGNQASIYGEAIRWAKTNHEQPCYPKDFPDFVILSNVNKVIKPCN
jgi:hypothetical protein